MRRLLDMFGGFRAGVLGDKSSLPVILSEK
jgi:hypothetical protein